MLRHHADEQLWHRLAPCPPCSPTSSLSRQGNRDLSKVTQSWDREELGVGKSWRPPQEGSCLGRAGDGEVESQSPKEQSCGMN